MNAFTHKPGRTLLAGTFFSPVHTKALWDKVWAEARRQAWWSDDLGCVGNDGAGNFYFQKPGCTTGFACVKVS